MAGTVSKIAKGAKNILLGKDKHFNTGAKAIKDFAINKVPKGAEKSLYQHVLPYELSKKAGFTGVALVGGYGLAKSGVDARHSSQMGVMSHGSARLSGMTDTVKLSKKIQDAQKGKPVALSNSSRNDGVEGDLVFALHNMR